MAKADITIKTDEEIRSLRAAGTVLATIHDELEKLVVPGNSTQDIEDRALELVETYDVEPMILGYQPDFAPRPYPAATCVSVNDVLVHGIPNENPYTFTEGDVVSIDMVLAKHGMVVDAARTVIAGSGSAEAQELLRITRKALQAGIAAATAGARVRDIGAAIEAVVPQQFGIVEVLCGHGVGYSVHEPPNIPNFVMRGASPVLQSGMVIAVEPMIIAGSKDVTFDDRDGYTVFTKNHALGAHMEHTIVVTDGPPDILTVK